MIILESILGYMVFGLENNWVEQMAIIGMMSVGLLITVIMIVMYKDEKYYEKIRNKT